MIKAEQEPVSKDLEEAAKRYDEEHMIENGCGVCHNIYEVTAEDAFKAGAKWMAEQGITSRGKVFTSAFTSYIKIPGIEKLLKDTFPEDTEVIVQIRKNKQNKKL